MANQRQHKQSHGKNLFLSFAIFILSGVTMAVSDAFQLSSLVSTSNPSRRNQRNNNGREVFTGIYDNNNAYVHYLPPLSMGKNEVDSNELQRQETNAIIVEDQKKNRDKSTRVNNILLKDVQARLFPIVSSFTPTTYNPVPLLTNRHIQTIGGVFLRTLPNCAYVKNKNEWTSLAFLLFETIWSVAVSSISGGGDGGDCSDYWDKREQIDTPDGDFFHVDYKYYNHDSSSNSSTDTTTSEGTVILVPGIETSSLSTLCIDMANAYQRLGFDVACINHRGCSGVPNNKFGGYHFGFTDDLKQFLGILKDRTESNGSGSGNHGNTQTIYLSAFSLGANIALKALGELGEGATTIYNIQGAAVAAAPFDIERNNKYANSGGGGALSLSINNLVYVPNFLQTMKEKCNYQLETYCNGDPNTSKFNYPLVSNAKTQADFENGWTCPVFGFDDNLDYYRKVSCGNFLDGIAVPTYIINAKDDPLFDPDYFPINQSAQGGGTAPIQMVQTEHGGHVGYLFHRPGPEDIVTKVVVGSRGGELENSRNRASKQERTVSSWMPTELARFIDHVHGQ